MQATVESNGQTIARPRLQPRRHRRSPPRSTASRSRSSVKQVANGPRRPARDAACSSSSSTARNNTTLCSDADRDRPHPQRARRDMGLEIPAVGGGQPTYGTGSDARPSPSAHLLAARHHRRAFRRHGGHWPPRRPQRRRRDHRQPDDGDARSFAASRSARSSAASTSTAPRSPRSATPTRDPRHRPVPGRHRRVCRRERPLHSRIRPSAPSPSTSRSRPRSTRSSASATPRFAGTVACNVCPGGVIDVPWPDITLLSDAAGGNGGLLNDNGDVLLETNPPAGKHLHQQHAPGEVAEDHRRRRRGRRQERPYPVPACPRARLATPQSGNTATRPAPYGRTSCPRVIDTRRPTARSRRAAPTSTGLPCLYQRHDPARADDQVAGGRIHIDAPLININGVLQSGRDHYVLTSARLAPERGARVRRRQRLPRADTDHRSEPGDQGRVRLDHEPVRPAGRTATSSSTRSRPVAATSSCSARCQHRRRRNPDPRRLPGRRRQQHHWQEVSFRGIDLSQPGQGTLLIVDKAKVPDRRSRRKQRQPLRHALQVHGQRRHGHDRQGSASASNLITATRAETIKDQGGASARSTSSTPRTTSPTPRTATAGSRRSSSTTSSASTRSTTRGSVSSTSTTRSPTGTRSRSSVSRRSPSRAAATTTRRPSTRTTSTRTRTRRSSPARPASRPSPRATTASTGSSASASPGRTGSASSRKTHSTSSTRTRSTPTVRSDHVPRAPTGAVDVECNAGVKIDGSILNPSGTTTINVTNGAISMFNQDGQVTALNLDLHATQGIGTATKPLPVRSRPTSPRSPRPRACRSSTRRSSRYRTEPTARRHSSGATPSACQLLRRRRTPGRVYSYVGPQGVTRNLGTQNYGLASNWREVIESERDVFGSATPCTSTSAAQAVDLGTENYSEPAAGTRSRPARA